MESGTTVVEWKGPGHTPGLVRTSAASLVLLSLAHFFIDLYTGALGALQPVLVTKLSLSLTQAGILGGVLVFSSSVMQPVYGILSDRFHTRMFTVLAPAVAGVFLSALGGASGFTWLMLLAALGGAGVASFHPQASAWAGQGIPETRGRWMALFISAGNLGLAAGPTFFSTVAAWWGLERTWWAAWPGVLVTVLLLAHLPDAARTSHSPRPRRDWGPLWAVWKPLAILYLLVVIRSIVQVTFGQFLPLYLHRERGLPVSTANYALSLYLGCGALGGLFGGHLADRLGRRAVIMISMIGCVPFLALFFFANGAPAWAGLALGGFILLFTIPVNIVMAQELAPSQTGTVSALMMGFGWGMAGLVFIPMTGWAADYFSLDAVLRILILFPLLGFLLAWKLPK